MSSSPYRVAPESPEEHEAAEPNPNRDLVPIFAMLWLASVVRVAVGLMRLETFGQEPTLAFLVVLLLPALMKGSLVDECP